MASRLVGCNTWFYFLSPGKGKLKKCISAKPVRRSEPRQWRIYPVSPFCRDLWRRHRGPLRLWSSLVWRIIALARYHRESANHRKFPAGIGGKKQEFHFRNLTGIIRSKYQPASPRRVLHPTDAQLEPPDRSVWWFGHGSKTPVGKWQWTHHWKIKTMPFCIASQQLYPTTF